MTDLLPCPFCGDVKKVENIMDGYDFVVHCFSCGTYGPWVDGNDHSFLTDDDKEAEARRLWNKRADIVVVNGDRDW